MRVTVSSKTIDESKIKIRSNLGEDSVPTTESYHKMQYSFQPFSYIAKKMIDDFNHKGGIEIEIDSEIPTGVGLGSSSACCVAAAGSLMGLFAKPSQDQVLKLALDAERTIFKEASGADTTVCTYGGIIEYEKESGFTKIESKNNFHLVIANSNQTHSTKQVVAKVSNFNKENPGIFSALCEKEAKLIDSVRKSLKHNDLVSLGKSMAENQTYLVEIGVSNEKLNSLIKTAQKTSYGAKITGAGGGGCIVALTDESNIKETLSNLSNFECFSARIDTKGLDTF